MFFVLFTKDGGGVEKNTFYKKKNEKKILLPQLKAIKLIH